MRRSVILSSLALLALTSGSAAAQPGTGAKYGSRDPVACMPGNSPRGAPTPALVAQLVRRGRYDARRA